MGDSDLTERGYSLLTSINLSPGSDWDLLSFPDALYPWLTGQVTFLPLFNQSTNPSSQSEPRGPIQPSNPQLTFPTALAPQTTSPASLTHCLTPDAVMGQTGNLLENLTFLPCPSPGKGRHHLSQDPQSDPSDLTVDAFPFRWGPPFLPPGIAYSVPSYPSVAGFQLVSGFHSSDRIPIQDDHWRSRIGWRLFLVWKSGSPFQKKPHWPPGLGSSSWQQELQDFQFGFFPINSPPPPTPPPHHHGIGSGIEKGGLVIQFIYIYLHLSATFTVITHLTLWLGYFWWWYWIRLGSISIHCPHCACINLIIHFICIYTYTLIQNPPHAFFIPY